MVFYFPRLSTAKSLIDEAVSIMKFQQSLLPMRTNTDNSSMKKELPMSDFDQLHKKQNRIFLVVIVNFLLFMILFTGAGFVIWQSATLVNRLSSDLTKAEETIGGLQERMQAMDTSTMMDRLTQNATDQLRESIRSSLADVDFAQPMSQLSDTLVVTQDMLLQSGNALQGINENVTRLDNDVIARKVADYVLQGLRDDVARQEYTLKSGAEKNE